MNGLSGIMKITDDKFNDQWNLHNLNNRENRNIPPPPKKKCLKDLDKQQNIQHSRHWSLQIGNNGAEKVLEEIMTGCFPI